MNVGDVTPSKDKKEKYIERCVAMHYFRRVDEHFYYDLQKKLLGDYYQDQNEYPKTLQISYDVIYFHTPSITTSSQRRTNFRTNFNIIFTQRKASKYHGNSQGQKQVPGTDMRITYHLCFKCN